MSEPIKLIIVGMGNRSMIYAKESLVCPDLFKIVGVVDTNPERVKLAKETFKIPNEHCFSSVEDLVKVPKFAHGVINGTMDQLHVPTSLLLLKHGYDILLEKPFAINQKEADKLVKCVKDTKRQVMVCHILRYTPFYKKINEIVKSGKIGKIINVQMSEQVSFFHESVSFVRGKYACSEKCASGMLLSKCSHDLDVLSWIMGESEVKSVSSVGSVLQFKPEMAPKNAGTHCILNCDVERDCIYSAKRLYLEYPQRWANNIWHEYGAINPDYDEKLKILSSPDNLYSRCVYKCDINIVDHQSLLAFYKDGATATFSMNGGAVESNRRIHITGTLGEITGVFEDGKFVVSCISPQSPNSKITRVVDVSKEQSENAHGGGDQAIIRDFVALLKGEKVSTACTLIEDSKKGHKLAFLAEESRRCGGKTLKW